MGINKRQKTVSRTPPPPVAAVQNADGTFVQHQGQREPFVCDPNMYVTMVWSWGTGKGFEAGEIPARLAQFKGTETASASALF